MRASVFAMAVACAIGLSACAYNVQPMGSPELTVYSPYRDKIAGKWALTVFTNDMAEDVHPTGFLCSANHYPLNPSKGFAQSASATFQNLVRDIEPLEKPISASALEANGFRGTIAIKGEALRARLMFMSEVLSASAQADVEIDASMNIEDAHGSLLQARATGHGTANYDAGMYCEGGAFALGLASERAMREAFGKLAETVANAPQMRNPKAK